MWVWSLGWEDPLEEDVATHSSILAWRIPMYKEAWWAIAHGVAELNMTEVTDHMRTYLLFKGKKFLHFFRSLSKSGIKSKS